MDMLMVVGFNLSVLFLCILSGYITFMYMPVVIVVEMPMGMPGLFMRVLQYHGIMAGPGKAPQAGKNKNGYRKDHGSGIDTQSDPKLARNGIRQQPTGMSQSKLCGEV